MSQQDDKDPIKRKGKSTENVKVKKPRISKKDDKTEIEEPLDGPFISEAGGKTSPDVVELSEEAVTDQLERRENFIRQPAAAAHIAVGVFDGFMEKLQELLAKHGLQQLVQLPGLQIIRNRMHDASPFMDAILTLRIKLIQAADSPSQKYHIIMAFNNIWKTNLTMNDAVTIIEAEQLTEDQAEQIADRIIDKELLPPSKEEKEEYKVETPNMGTRLFPDGNPPVTPITVPVAPVAPVAPVVRRRTTGATKGTGALGTLYQQSKQMSKSFFGFKNDEQTDNTTTPTTTPTTNPSFRPRKPRDKLDQISSDSATHAANSYSAELQSSLKDKSYSAALQSSSAAKSSSAALQSSSAALQSSSAANSYFAALESPANLDLDTLHETEQDARTLLHNPVKQFDIGGEDPEMTEITDQRQLQEAIEASNRKINQWLSSRHEMIVRLQHSQKIIENTNTFRPPPIDTRMGGAINVFVETFSQIYNSNERMISQRHSDQLLNFVLSNLNAMQISDGMNRLAVDIMRDRSISLQDRIRMSNIIHMLRDSFNLLTNDDLRMARTLLSTIKRIEERSAKEEATQQEILARQEEKIYATGLPSNELLYETYVRDPHDILVKISISVANIIVNYIGENRVTFMEHGLGSILLAIIGYDFPMFNRFFCFNIIPDNYTRLIGYLLFFIGILFIFTKKFRGRRVEEFVAPRNQLPALSEGGNPGEDDMEIDTPRGARGGLPGRSARGSFRRNSKRKSMRKSKRKSMRKSKRKSMRKSKRKSMRKSKRKSMRKSKRKSMRKSKLKSKRKSMRKSKLKSKRKSMRKSKLKSKRKSMRKSKLKSKRKSMRKSKLKSKRKSMRKSKLKSKRKSMRK